MTNKHLSPQELITFHDEKVTHPTALSYMNQMENAKTPFITVERREDNKFNVIGGFKYISGIRFLKSSTQLYCSIVDRIKSEKDRKLAILQRCLADNEKIKYKEILVQELTHDFNMNEFTISLTLGHDAEKIKKYMYNQIIPRTYLVEANKLNIKPLVQAIYLANKLLPNEKRILTELSLDGHFKKKHLSIYKRYRKDYNLFEDFALARKQVLQAIDTDQPTYEYWKSIPHPMKFYIDNTDFNEDRPPH